MTETLNKPFYEIRWEQVQIEAATAWHNLDIAVEMIESNKAELDSEQYAAIVTEVEHRQQEIQDLLLKGKLAYDEAVQQYGGLNERGDAATT